MNTGELGTRKPHLFYNKCLKQWTCFHWGRGYITSYSMRAAYLKWRELSGLIDKIGEQA